MKSNPRCEYVDEDHFRFIHDCLEFAGLGQMPVVATDRGRLLPLGESGWVWTSDKKSLLPSIQCLRCGTHGFWTDGEWVKAP